MRLKIENFNVMWVHWKVHFLQGGSVVKKTIYREELPKKGGLDSLQI